MNCFLCGGNVIWSGDFTCEDYYDCTCEAGLISCLICSGCEAEYEIKSGCKGT
jgi:hypothetical protein